jgi:protein involved in polysaccharide export with SLBB domain
MGRIGGTGRMGRTGRNGVIGVVTALLLVVAVHAQEKQTFFITGHVRNAGAYAYREGLTAGMAIAEAGGFVPGRADDMPVLEVSRLVDGKLVRVPLTINDVLKSNDVLIVLSAGEQRVR